jgi:hypothetical protein
MTCVNSYLFWLLLVLATPGAFMGAFLLWLGVESIRIHIRGKR